MEETMLKDKQCVACGETYTPTGRCSKYCSNDCREAALKEKSKQYYKTYALKKGWAYGVGSGGLTGSGEDNQNYKNGIGIFQTKLRHEIRKERRYCERCGEDLINVSRHHWCVHHIDHDRTNNKKSNLELLCKRCHQVEHNCIQALEGATTKVVRDKTTGRYKRIEAHDSES